MTIEPERVVLKTMMNAAEAVEYPDHRRFVEHQARYEVQTGVARRGGKLVGDLDLRWFAQGSDDDGRRFIRPWSVGEPLDGATELVCEVSGMALLHPDAPRS